MRITAKPEIAAGVSAVLAVFRKRQRGATVTYAEVEKAGGILRASSSWQTLVKRIKREVRREKGQTLVAVPNVGYRIETVTEQLHDRSIRLQQQATRRMSRDLVETEALPDTELTDHQRLIKSRKITQSKTARRAVLYSLRLGHLLTKPSGNGIPRPPR